VSFADASLDMSLDMLLSSKAQSRMKHYNDETVFSDVFSADTKQQQQLQPRVRDSLIELLYCRPT